MPTDITPWMFLVYFVLSIALGMGWALGNLIVARLFR